MKEENQNIKSELDVIKAKFDDSEQKVKMLTTQNQGFKQQISDQAKKIAVFETQNQNLKVNIETIK